MTIRGYTPTEAEKKTFERNFPMPSVGMPVFIPVLVTITSGLLIYNLVKKGKKGKK